MKALVGTASSVGLAVAMLLSAAPAAHAQADTVRRVRSDVRIGVQKDRTLGRNTTTPRDSVTVVSTGEVELINATKAKLDSMALDAERERRRTDSVMAVVAGLESKNADLSRSVTAFQDSLVRVRGDVTTLNTRATALSDSLRTLNGKWSRFRNGSLFNNSGFYIGLGSGANFTSGTLEDMGYHEGLNVVVPIGWQKRGQTLGFRGELGVQTFDGQNTNLGPFANPDPKLYTAVGMLAVHFPINEAKTNTFFLMGGGGAYVFRKYGASSALADRLGTTSTLETKTTTKLGVTGGAGIELKILGATSFFLESRITNVFAENSASGLAGGKNLMWIPVTMGFQLR